MKLHILSDLHLEFGKWPRTVDVNTIDADVTILAGDIGVGLQGLDWALTIQRPVIYVMGNHEFYGQRPMTDLWRQARQKVAGTHIHLLENESVVMDDCRGGQRVRFLGATLWTDFCLYGAEQQKACMENAAHSMTDFSAIYISRRGKSLAEFGHSAGHQGDRLTPRKTVALHQESRAYLERELATPPDPADAAVTWTKTVVVTHHAPSAKGLQSDRPANDLDPAFASNLDTLVGQADLWVFGHTHIVADCRVAGPRGGRLVSNQRGYVGSELVRDFDPGLVVEV